MVIFNKKLSVSPIITHEPLKFVSKNISKSKIVKKIKLLINFGKPNLIKNQNSYNWTKSTL